MRSAADVERVAALLFAWACGLLDIDCRSNSRYELSIARRASVERMDSFVGPKR